MPSQSRRAFSIRLFLPDGSPDGVRIGEKSNWTGRAVVCPRSQFGVAKSRPEFNKAGVYVLRGPSESGDLPALYIGEGDPARPRLESHNARKDFWTSLVLFASKDENLNKAHVQYLEARLVELAAAAKRAELDNGNIPQRPNLSEADVADAEGFLGDLLLCLPVVGVNLFEKAVADALRSDRDLLFLRSKGIEARGLDSSEGFVVLAGSRAARATVPSCHPYLIELRKSLIDKGVLVTDGETYRLSQDYTFNSPSTAAGVMLGRSSNGRAEWKDAKGRSLKEIQEAEAELA